jgi:hypothetical protein
MRPKITPEEIALLVEDLDMLGEQNLVGIEAYEALYLLEMRRQTAKLNDIKRALEEESEFPDSLTPVVGGEAASFITIICPIWRFTFYSPDRSTHG